MDNQAVVAIYLHNKFCRYNHADECMWFYEKNDWNGNEHKEWLLKAEEVINVVLEHN